MMLYEALVIDNSSFYSNGKIQVRIPDFYNSKMSWNLAENYPNFKDEANIEGANYTNDFEALVYSPYGGGRNFGAFFLPQINQKGVVMPIGMGENKFLWLGSFFEPTRKENFEVEYVNIPSDKMENEGPDTDGSQDGEQNMDAESLEDALKKNFVARFKTTSGDSQEGVNWEESRTSNIIVIGDKKASITHFTEENGWDDTTPIEYQTLELGTNKDDEQVASIKYTKDKMVQEITQKEGVIEAKIDNDGTITNVTISAEDGVTVSTENDVTLDIEGKLKVADASDQVVLYSELKSIIEKIEKHIHQTPNGPTVGDPLNPDMSPLSAKTTTAKNDMKSEKIETN